MCGDQGTQPRAVDVVYIFHIQDNLLLSFADQALHFLKHGVASLAEHYAAVQRHHGDAIYFAICHGCHDDLLPLLQCAGPREKIRH
jgi:hypothetical protein